MDVFLFEYVTSGGFVPEEIVVEGLGMFKSLYTDFDRFSGVDRTNYLVKPEYKDALSLQSLHSDEIHDPVDPAEIKQRVEEYAEKSDCSLIIAPEDDGLLLELTKIVEGRSENLGSGSKGIAVASDKWKTYKKLKRKVNVPTTSEKPLDPPFVLKPKISCGGEGIEIVESEGETSKIKPGFIAQELVEGKNLSVSLLIGDDINILSVNGQMIENFRYTGAEVPAQLSKDDFKPVFEEAVKAVECIKGLYGYVGVDVVLAEAPYVIEINARLTTPSIIFDRVYGINLAELIFKNHYGGLTIKPIRLNPQNSFKLEKAERDRIKAETKKVIDEVIVEYGKYALICSNWQTPSRYPP